MQMGLFDDFMSEVIAGAKAGLKEQIFGVETPRSESQGVPADENREILKRLSHKELATVAERTEDHTIVNMAKEEIDQRNERWGYYMRNFSKDELREALAGIESLSNDELIAVLDNQSEFTEFQIVACQLELAQRPVNRALDGGE